MRSLIEHFVERQKYNWNSPLKLTMSAIISVRMFEMCDDIETIQRIAKLLQKIRDIASEWIAKVHAAIEKTQDQTDVIKLRENLTEICIAGALTFNVHFQHPHFNEVFIESEKTRKPAAHLWLDFVVTMNSNILLNKANGTQSNHRLFVRLVRRIGVSLQGTIQQMMMANNHRIQCRFMQARWSAYAICRPLTKHNEIVPQQFGTLVKINGNSLYAHVDIVTGDFIGELNFFRKNSI